MRDAPAPHPPADAAQRTLARALVRASVPSNDVVLIPAHHLRSIAR